jgi:hypothetical protein
MSSHPYSLEAVERLTLDILQRMNEDLPAEDRVPLEPEAVIMGEGGLLDSLGIANFIVGMEEAIEQGFKRSVPLSDQDLADLFEEPSITVRSFAQLVLDRLNG